MTELELLTAKIQAKGTCRVAETHVEDTTRRFEHHLIDQLLPELVVGEEELTYTITIKVKPHTKLGG